MKILVDTSVWSLALRKKPKNSEELVIISKLQGMITNSLVVVLGTIRQELLSGISDDSQFEKLKTAMRYYDDFRLYSEHYETAAKFHNLCRKKGIQGSHTDFLICAVANMERFSIFTLDKDFENYQNYIDISLISHS